MSQSELEIAVIVKDGFARIERQRTTKFKITKKFTGKYRESWTCGVGPGQSPQNSLPILRRYVMYGDISCTEIYISVIFCLLEMIGLLEMLWLLEVLCLHDVCLLEMLGLLEILGLL